MTEEDVLRLLHVSKEFVLGGRAVFTVETPERHYTYRVKFKEATQRKWFVSLLTGPDNTANYTYMGVMDPETGAVTTTANSKYREDAYPLRLLNRVLACVWNGDHQAYEKHGYKTHHEGRCCRCGRALTVPHSIVSGIGPECAQKM